MKFYNKGKIDFYQFMTAIIWMSYATLRQKLLCMLIQL